MFEGDGLAKRGVLIRHLVMPGLLEEGKEIIKWIVKELGRDTFVNIMGQYHPAGPLLGTGEQRSRCVVGTGIDGWPVSVRILTLYDGWGTQATHVGRSLPMLVPSGS